MLTISFDDAFQVLLLQAADEGRGEVLFGESLERARRVLAPFMVGESFPGVYLECPLLGEPFLDVTLLYSKIPRGMRIESDAAAGTEAMIDWFAAECADDPSVCFGFELDTKEPELPAAAVHFQPRSRSELVRPFCEAAGEAERADLYLDLAARMPEGWPLSFFGMFRGRPGFPLRVCGYLSAEEKNACAADSRHLASVFDTVGFSAYDDAMLEDVCALMAVTPDSVDFQFDVYPDGSLGDVFAIDAQFGLEQPEAVCASFEGGPSGRVMDWLGQAGIADERRKLIPAAAFARSIPATRPDGSIDKYAFTLMPQWVKARWRAGELQPAKMYYYAHAGFLEDEKRADR